MTWRGPTPVNQGLHVKQEPQSHSKDRVLNATFQTKAYEKVTNRLNTASVDRKSAAERQKVPIRLITLNKTSNDHAFADSGEKTPVMIPNTIRKYRN